MSARGPAGFTLLELTVVLGLAALILALTLPRLGGGLEGLRVRAASRQVAAFLRSARTQAVVQNRTITVSVDPRGGALQVNAYERGVAGRGFTVPNGTYLAILDETNRPRGDRMIQIRFSPRGGSDGATLGVGGAGRLIPIAVDPLTGRVTIQ